MTSDERTRLRNRLAELSEAQRQRLARAVGGQSGADRLVAFLSGTGHRPGADELKAHLSKQLPEYMIPRRFVVLDEIPRTRAGKIDRESLSEADGTELPSESATTGFVEPRTDVEARLAEVWKGVLGLDEISVHDDFFEIGGDSLLSIRAIARAGKEGLRIAPETFFDRPTVAALAAHLEEAKAPVQPAEQGIVVGEAPLTPIQHWFFEAITDGTHHWNQSLLLEVPADLDIDRCVAPALLRLGAHHDALRLRFYRASSGWVQEFMPEWTEPPLRVVSVPRDPAARDRRMAEEASAEQASLRLEEGRLFRAILFRTGTDRDRLLLIAHHLLVDVISWGIVLEDLAALLEEPLAASAQLPAKTLSAKAWARMLGDAAGKSEVQEAASRWLEIVEHPVAALPVDMAGESNRHAAATTLTVSLTREQTALLLDQAGTRLEATSQEVVLTALLLAWQSFSGENALRIDVEGHGRDAGEQVDVSRTVGWFTTLFPLLLRPAAPGAAGALSSVKVSLREGPSPRASYGILRYLSADTAVRNALREAQPAEILFNYMGAGALSVRPDGILKPVEGPRGAGRSPNAPRGYRIEVNGRLEDRSLRLDIEYARPAHGDSAIERFGDTLRAALLDLARITPAPFALAGLDAKGLDKVAELLAEIDEE